MFTGSIRLTGFSDAGLLKLVRAKAVYGCSGFRRGGERFSS